MSRRLLMIVLPLTLGLVWVLPSQWQALRLGKAQAFALNRAATRAVQPARYEFVEHVIDYAHPCDDNFYPRVIRNSAQATYDFTFRSDTLAAGCTSALIPDGKITLNFPASFTEGVAFTPGLNVTGTFQLRVDAQHFSVRGYGLTVDTVIDRLPKREDPGVHQDLRNAPCPLSRFRKAPPLNGGTGAAPGLNPFANNASCSVKAPDLFQDFEGNQVLLISTVDLVVGGDPIGPANYFNYTGLRLLRFTITSKYKPATNSCPALGLQNGLASPEQTCPAKLLVEAQTRVFASDPCPVKITARKADGTLDTSFNGNVQVSLTTDKPNLGCLRSSGQCAPSLTVALEGGVYRQEFALQTPEQELKFFSVLKPSVVLEGKAIIKAESGNVSTTSEVEVKSPLDLKIERIEVQQGVKQDTPGTLVQGKDLLIRVFISANTDQFSKYQSIEGITAELFIRGKRGDIANSPFFLAHGALGNSRTPNEPYVFTERPAISVKEVGGDSLNFVLKADLVKEEQLSFSARLNDVYPDRDPTNNFKDALPATIPFVQSKAVTILYSRARLRYSNNSLAPLPSEEGLLRQMEFVQLAYPISKGKLRFVDSRQEEVLTDLPTTGAFGNAWFWLTNLGSASAQAAVFFVDNDYFRSIGRAGLHGITIGSFVRPSLAGDTFVFSGGSVCAVNATCGPNVEGHCETLAHEIGHTYSLGDTFQDATAIYSTTNERRADATESGNRIEPGSFSWFANKFIMAESGFRDFMGNNPRAWIDGKTWDELRSKLRPRLSSLQLTQAREADQTAPPVQESTGPFVVVEGLIQKGGAARLDNAYTLTGNYLSSSSSVGSHVIETLDANSAVLSSLTFAPEFRPLDANFELDQTNFSFALPFSSAVRQIRLRTGANVLASRLVSANPPSLSFTSDFGGQSLTGSKTVAWTSSDADGDALTYSLFYSPDGQLRVPLVVNTSATSYQWNADEMPSGPSARLTLMATDGVKATLIDSRQFTLPNRAPQIVILSPSNQQQFKPGELVDLEGSFHDPEEGLELSPQLEWTSDIQGALGTGKRIARNNLSTGTHRITAAGADSQGARGAASITVIVRADNFSNLAAAQTNLDFGNLTVGQTRDLTLTIQNSGNAPFTVNAITSNNARFVVTTPAAPFTIAARSQQEANVRFTPVAAGDQAGTLTIAANASNRTSLSIALTGKATGATARAVATVSAASFSGQTLAPESIVAAFGTNLATSVVLADTVPLPTSLAGTTVRVRDSLGTERLAPLFFVAPQQINYLIPAGTAVGAATVTVASGDGALSIGTATIAAVAPGLFTANATGQGVPAAVALRVKANGAQSYESVARFDQAQNRFVAVPIDLGPAGDQVFLLLFGTGLRYRSALAAVTCRLGGVASEVSFVGEVSGLAGLDQVNLSVPRTLSVRGEVDLVLTVDGSMANTVRVAFAGTRTCGYALSSSSQSFPFSSGTGSVNVMAQSGCAWTATSNTSFITLNSGATGNGNGTVNYSVTANTGTSQRTGTLTIAGQTFTVTQAGGSGACSFTLTPTNQVFAASGGSGSINVATQAGCNWMAATAENWIAITAGRTGSGNGRVDFTLAANSSTIPRAGAILVAGQTFLIGQTGTGATCRLLPISIGQTINGELATSDCGSPVYGSDYYADLFYFTATAGQRVAIQLTSAAFDAYLILIGPDGEPVTEDDDGGGGTDARIPASSGFLTLPFSGTYIIEASSALEREIGAYRLSLSAPSSSVSGKTKGAVTNRAR